jgi:hypothetical protein
MGMPPRAPTFEELADQARAGDSDAAFELARRAPDQGFLPWLAKWVPAGEMTAPIFDVFSDAYSLMLLDRQACKKGA